MKKFSLLIVIYFCTISLFAQVDISKLDGEWVVTEIINLENGEITKGKYAETGEYIRFHFKKGNLYINKSPFDKGLPETITVKYNTINIIPHHFLNLPSNFPELKYGITYLDDKKLVLKTNDASQNQIQYSFVRIESKELPKTIDFQAILLKKINYERSYSHNYSYNYNFKQNTYVFPSPKFKSDYSLGGALIYSIKFPDEFEKGKISDELIIEVLINSKGKVEETRIKKGIDESIDESIEKFFNKSKWILPKGHQENITLIFHVYLALVDDYFFGAPIDSLKTKN